MNDKVETMGSSILQHGPDSQRVYLMKLFPEDLPDLLDKIMALAKGKGYTKVFAKIPETQGQVFLEQGYRVEGRIPGFYRNHEAALFLGYYLTPERALEADPEALDAITELAQSKRVGKQQHNALPDTFQLRAAKREDAKDLAMIYRTVFKSYPFPIHDAAYLIKTMQSHVRYFLIEADGQPVAAASAEMDRTGQNAEMTDFATLPDFLGHGLAVHLLHAMERSMPDEGIRTVYTIARAESPGINITFTRCGYHFGGRLKNNTQIAGKIESMNLWYKHLTDS